MALPLCLNSKNLSLLSLHDSVSFLVNSRICFFTNMRSYCLTVDVFNVNPLWINLIILLTLPLAMACCHSSKYTDLIFEWVLLLNINDMLAVICLLISGHSSTCLCFNKTCVNVNFFSSLPIPIILGIFEGMEATGVSLYGYSYASRNGTNALLVFNWNTNVSLRNSETSVAMSV